jgi:hypothetical protein
MKNLIMSLDLIFMQIRPIIIQFDLEFALFLHFFGIMGYNQALNLLQNCSLIPRFAFSTLPAFIIIFLIFFLQKGDF